MPNTCTSCGWACAGCAACCGSTARWRRRRTPRWRRHWVRCSASWGQRVTGMRWPSGCGPRCTRPTRPGCPMPPAGRRPPLPNIAPPEPPPTPPPKPRTLPPTPTPTPTPKRAPLPTAQRLPPRRRRPRRRPWPRRPAMAWTWAPCCARRPPSGCGCRPWPRANRRRLRRRRCRRGQRPRPPCPSAGRFKKVIRASKARRVSRATMAAMVKRCATCCVRRCTGCCARSSATPRGSTHWTTPRGTACGGASSGCAMRPTRWRRCGPPSRSSARCARWLTLRSRWAPTTTLSWRWR